MESEAGVAGVVCVDKPTGKSSFAMVQRIRRQLGIKKVGHAGTLDPFASGLLIICVGRSATRHIEQFMQGKKRYQATLHLGVETLTHDPEGEIIAEKKVLVADNGTAIADAETQVIGRSEIEQVVGSFAGKQKQAPPPFSAAKYKGKPLYHYARQGIMIEKKPKDIEIYSLKCLRLEQQEVGIEVECSRGTYIRVLGADIGKKLGCGAHLSALRRTASGPFSVSNSIHGDLLEQDGAKETIISAMMSIEEALKQIEQSQDYTKRQLA